MIAEQFSRFIQACIGKGTSLKARALHAGMWATVVAIGAAVMRFGSSLIMTRLLVPDVFGVVALATVLFIISESSVGHRIATVRDVQQTWRGAGFPRYGLDDFGESAALSFPRFLQ